MNNPRPLNLVARVALSTVIASGLCVAGCATRAAATRESDATATTRAVAVAPDIIPRAAWGSQPLPIDESRRHTPRTLTIHHAGVLWKSGDDPAQKLRNLQSWGQRDKNWPDVPYHYLIAPDGRIYEGRDIAYQPETNTNYDLAGIVNVHLWGDFDKQRVSLEQLRSTVDLLAFLSHEYGLDLEQLQGHRDAAPGQTSCPGTDLYRYLEDGSLLRWAREAKEGHAPDIQLLDALDAGPTTMIAP